MIDKEKEYIEFTKICGDCGRRFKMKFEMPEYNLRTKKGMNQLVKFTSFMFPKYNVVCNKCNLKRQNE